MDLLERLVSTCIGQAANWGLGMGIWNKFSESECERGDDLQPFECEQRTIHLSKYSNILNIHCCRTQVEKTMFVSRIKLNERNEHCISNLLKMTKLEIN